MTSLESPRILVAEDNPALSHVVKFNLERAGFNVTVVHNGRLAWEALQQSSFQMLVADHQMPEMSGIELVGKIRSDPRFQDLPIMMLTAKRMELDLERLRDELRINHIYPKPFSPMTVVKVVRDQVASLAGTG